jgi:hypothetical protein
MQEASLRRAIRDEWPASAIAHGFTLRWNGWADCHGEDGHLTRLWQGEGTGGFIIGIGYGNGGFGS